PTARQQILWKLDRGLHLGDPYVIYGYYANTSATCAPAARGALPLGRLRFDKLRKRTQRQRG
ncbi:MAG: hypothetical protein ACLGI7_05905, partial [Gammaproteobacteria bacterium]